MRFIAPCSVSFADTEQLHTRTAGSQFREHFIKRTSLRKDHSVTKSLMFTECLLRAEFWTWTPHVTLPTKPRSNYCQPLWQVAEGKVAAARGPHGICLGRQTLPILAAPSAGADSGMVPATQLPMLKDLA